MKKYTIYIVACFGLVLGFIIGWIFFHNSNMTTTDPGTDTKTITSNDIWTCSMHPQIRQNEPGDCPICGMDLIPASKVNNDDDIGFQMTENAIKLAQIQTTVVGSNEAPHTGLLKLNGKIKEDETTSASLVSHIPGRIEKLYVTYTGEQVTKGQKIATLYSPELITAQKELLEAKKISDISPALLSAAKNKLKYWKIEEQVIQNILNSGTIQENFAIHADHSGVVKNKKVSVGDYLRTGEVLFDIQNLTSLWAIFDVYENDLPQVKVGRYIEFTTPSVPDKTFRARITFVNPVINPDTRAATIRAEIKNSTGKLKPEMFVSGQLKIPGQSSTLTIPKSAVLWTGERSVVYVKVPDADLPSYEYREIELGASVSNGYEVLGGLDNGEEVVTNGAFVIDASAQLNNQASMMNRNVKKKGVKAMNKLPNYTREAPVTFKEELTRLTETYLLLKDDLVDSNAENAMNNAQNMVDQVNKVDMNLIEGDAHKYWMKQLNAIVSHGNKIAQSKEIEEQRNQFDFLSQALINSLKVFGVDNKTFYVQHCPMAKNNQGADWISNQKKINNPYFGDKMLTCGIVQDTINSELRENLIE